MVLAADLTVERPVPVHMTALRAGYAVASGDLVGASAYAPHLLREAPARVEAGDPLPPGTDAVLPADAVTDGPIVEVVLEAAPGENVRRAGEDLMAGHVLRRAGEVMRPLDAAIGAAAGLAEVLARSFSLGLYVAPQHRSTVELFTARARGGIRTNIVPIRFDAQWDAQTMLDGSGADLIVAAAPPPSLVSGTSTPFGAVLAQGVALRGAETTLVAMGPTPVIVAPARLDVLVTLWCCLIDPFCAFLAQRGATSAWRRARLTRKIASQVGLTELALLRQTMGGLEPVGVGSITLAALAQAEGFLVIPPECEGFSEGTEVEAYEL
jgi:molybdopterin biosynthesis enzyme